MLAACTSTASLTDVELSQAATQGDGRAQYELAKRLANQPDYPNAMRWMQQATEQSGPLAADQQIRANAAWQVGEWYQVGLGAQKSGAGHSVVATFSSPWQHQCQLSAGTDVSGAASRQTC